MKQEIRQIKERFISIDSKEGEKISLQSFEGKMCKNVCFCVDKTCFCFAGPRAKRRIVIMYEI